MPTFNTRIQLKTDTTANWNKLPSNTFRPLAGEMIIYQDGASSRLKVGDGSTFVENLPFIDADIQIERVESINNLVPAIGSINKLYIVTSTNQIYYYNNSNSTYIELSPYSLQTSTINIPTIESWYQGIPAKATVTNHTLNFVKGVVPTLGSTAITFVTGITRPVSQG